MDFVASDYDIQTYLLILVALNSLIVGLSLARSFSFWKW